MGAFEPLLNALHLGIAMTALAGKGDVGREPILVLLQREHADAEADMARVCAGGS